MKGAGFNATGTSPCRPRVTENADGASSDEDILDLIQAATRRQMISDVPVGSLLSGGLDSTTVTAVMAKKLGVPVGLSR